MSMTPGQFRDLRSRRIPITNVDTKRNSSQSGIDDNRPMKRIKPEVAAPVDSKKNVLHKIEEFVAEADEFTFREETDVSISQ